MPEPTANAGVAGRVRQRIMELHHSGERSEEYDTLRAALDGVPKAERDLRWRRVDILLDVQFRTQGRRVIRRLHRLRDVYAHRGKPERYERLWETVQDLLGEMTVTTHGYSPRLTLRPAHELWSQVGAVLERLERTGRAAFVNSGTLLGLVRGEGVIANDDDVDVAVLLHADGAETAAYEWLELRRSLRESGLLDDEFDARATVHTKLASPDGLKLDVFPGWMSDDRLYLWPYSYGEVRSDDVLPLQRIAVGESIRVPAPARPAALLAANYGTGWRTPDPLFAFDWASAKQRFGHFRELVKDGYASG